MHEYIQTVHEAHLDDIKNFQGCHRMYLKSSERFDQKIDIVVNMEKNNQALMEQMRITAQLVDEMINLKILTLDAQTA